MDKNLQRFREVFFEEAREHLESMETVLLGLEGGGTADAETLNGIFRSAHTIKGGSGMFGLDDTARFTHSLENLLDQVRAGKVLLTAPLIDVLLRSCDVLRCLLQAAQQGEDPPAAMEAVLQAIQEANTPVRADRPASNNGATIPESDLESGGQKESKTEAQTDAEKVAVHVPEQPIDGERHWRIHFRPAGDVLRRGLNPLLAFRELGELGRVSELRMDTTGIPRLVEMDAEASYAVWTLRFDSNQPEARIRETFEFLHEGDGLEMTEIREATARPAVLRRTHGTGAQASSESRSHEQQTHGNQAPMNQTPLQTSLDAAGDARPTLGPAANAAPPAGTPEGASPAPPASSATAVSDPSSTIRVDVDLLDRLMNQVGELVLARNQILQFAGTTDDASLTAASQRLNLITSELQEGVMKTRMQPIGVAWSMMPRLVRDLARTCGKQVELSMEGSETELDRTIIEAIRDPLTHLVRNACDHGLETPERRAALGKPVTGKLLLGAFHEGGHVIIEITDDGSGIDIARVKGKALERGLISPDQAARMSDREAVQLIYRPGFSTAERITGVSGRGVGMDVVKTNIERVGGTIDVASNFGSGTSVHIKIPLTLAIIPGMVVEGGGERFVIPQVSLVELVRFEEEQASERIEHIHNAPVCRLRGKLLPLVYLNETLGLSGGWNSESNSGRADPANAPGSIDSSAGESSQNPRHAMRGEQAVNIVVLQAEDRQFGLVVDGIRDTQEIVVKPLGKQLKGLDAYSGATVMGDGRVVLILDVAGVARLAGLNTTQYASGAREAAAAAGATDAHASERQALLLFHSPGFERLAVPLALVSRLEEFPGARVEHSGGRPVVQYRDRILPLVSLASVAPARLLTDGASRDNGKACDPLEADPLQVIVFMDGARGLGLVVGEILDIVQEEVHIRKRASQPGLIGSAVIGGQVTDFLDLRAVVDASGEKWASGAARSRRATVLVAGSSSFTRTLVRTSVEMGGHHVIEASSRTEAIEKMSRQRIDLVALAPDLENDLEQAEGGGSLIALLRKQAGRDVPLLPLDSSAAADHLQLTASLESMLAQV